MNTEEYFAKIKAQKPCTTDERIYGFITALQSNNSSWVRNFNWLWVVYNCFTLDAYHEWHNADWSGTKFSIGIFLQLVRKDESWK